MKNYVSLGILSLAFIPLTFATSPTMENLEDPIFAANFLATKWVIEDHSSDTSLYKVYENISRREMLKIMMNLSELIVVDRCNGQFKDLDASDWGCKYAEAAADVWFIAKNEYFRPDDNVTQIEALKMIMQAKNIVKIEVSDWRAGYSEWAVEAGLILSPTLDYDAFAQRWWIFRVSSKTFPDMLEQSMTPSEDEWQSDSQDLTPEEESLIEQFFE